MLFSYKAVRNENLDHANMYLILKQKIIANGTSCWLINTGWTGGSYGIGTRMPIKATRAILDALLTGKLDDAEFRRDDKGG